MCVGGGQGTRETSLFGLAPCSPIFFLLLLSGVALFSSWLLYNSTIYFVSSLESPCSFSLPASFPLIRQLTFICSSVFSFPSSSPFGSLYLGELRSSCAVTDVKLSPVVQWGIHKDFQGAPFSCIPLSTLFPPLGHPYILTFFASFSPSYPTTNLPFICSASLAIYLFASFMPCLLL